MKLKDIYINLQGKSGAELEELYQLVKQDLWLGIDFRENPNNSILDWEDGLFIGSSLEECKELNKQEITIEQLKEILQPMNNKGQQLIEEAKRRGYAKGNFKCLIGFDRAVHENIDEWHYEQSQDRLYTMPDVYGGNVVYKEGVWAEIVSESLEQQLEKVKAEVERLEKAIEEKNNPKVGDWVYDAIDKCIYQKTLDDNIRFEVKITDQVLINKLNELIK